MFSSNPCVKKRKTKSNWTEGAVQVEANSQERLSDYLHFRLERAAEMPTYGEMQRIAFITFELALVTLEWTIAAAGKLFFWLGSYFAYSSTRTRHTCTGVRHCWKVSIRINTRTHHTCMGVRQCRKVSNRIFDMRKVGQGRGVQFSLLCHSTASVKIYKRHFSIL